MQTVAVDICSALRVIRDINELTCSCSRGCSIVTKATCPLLATSVGPQPPPVSTLKRESLSALMKSLTCFWQQGTLYFFFLSIHITDSLVMNVCNMKVRLCQLNEDGVENQFNWAFILEMYKMVIFFYYGGVTCFWTVCEFTQSTKVPLRTF